MFSEIGKDRLSTQCIFALAVFPYNFLAVDALLHASQLRLFADAAHAALWISQGRAESRDHLEKVMQSFILEKEEQKGKEEPKRPHSFDIYTCEYLKENNINEEFGLLLAEYIKAIKSWQG